VPVYAGDSGDVLERGGQNAVLSYGWRQGVLFVKEGVDRSIGKSDAEMFEYLLASTHAGQPVVTQHDAKLPP
jgi:hypothetical protein